MEERILHRIQNKVQDRNLIEKLAGQLSLSDLQSLLMEVFQRQISEHHPAHISRQYDQ